MYLLAYKQRYPPFCYVYIFRLYFLFLILILIFNQGTGFALEYGPYLLGGALLGVPLAALYSYATTDPVSQQKKLKFYDDLKMAELKMEALIIKAEKICVQQKLAIMQIETRSKQISSRENKISDDTKKRPSDF